MADIMKKNEAVALLQKMLENAGFESEMTTMSELPVLRHKNDGSDYANITLYPECDWESGTYTVKANASVRQMGGTPSVEELFAAAEQIKSAAAFMKMVNRMEIRYRR